MTKHLIEIKLQKCKLPYKHHFLSSLKCGKQNTRNPCSYHLITKMHLLGAMNLSQLSLLTLTLNSCKLTESVLRNSLLNVVAKPALNKILWQIEVSLQERSKARRNAETVEVTARGRGGDGIPCVLSTLCRCVCVLFWDCGVEK